ncbi:MAG TPA: isoprenoid biosynthesis glyoxalase ElbB [Candidatus Ignatzschineria merdigallinarum]|uniref:Isoprenoid biosynthesis glyoxalase ElbB n=1 Tax=Candidatus Ignatzschineria merdigallinarum TaxID=2838621 RepID=A0A9D1TUJ4_9GAMM|nr:isoprenoid biosynthesis glyoxalase ElbB [Candidatus Ignatzschineria merdigallinarum]
MSTKHFALILAGCGHLDGAEITEASALNIALSKAGYTVSFYAPNRHQKDTIEHLSGEELTPNRNILEEAARIARGNIKPIEELTLSEVDGIAMAGGFGVIKNFTNFLDKGLHASLQPDIGDKIKEAIVTKKPLIAICAAPMAVAIALKELGIQDATLTFGKAANAEGFLPALKEWDIDHIETSLNEAYTDPQHAIITSGAYMDSNATPYEIFLGAEACVNAMTTLS